MMITRDTAADIWNAYREIEVGEKLLADMKSQREMMPMRVFTAWASKLQLPHTTKSVAQSRRVFVHMHQDVSPTLAESVIRAHIQNKRAELAEINERARIELGINDHV